MSELVQNVSGVILVTCAGNACKEVIRKAREDISGVTDVFRVNQKKYDSADVVINMNVETKEQLLNAKDSILNMNGVKSIKYRITE